MCPLFESDPKILKEKREKVQVEPQKQPKKKANEPLQDLQQTVGNQVVQRLVIQRSGDEGFDLEEETSKRIKAERKAGAALDSELQSSMGQAFSQDFSGVRVHTSSESDVLNREIGAKAFTTGQDIFFRGGAYEPASEGGQRLIAHELTHVVQQSGSVGDSGAPFRVHPAGDAYEQEADSVSRQVLSSGVSGLGGVQMQEQDEEENDLVQMQEEEEEDEKEFLQMQAEEEEEEKTPAETPEEIEEGGTVKLEEEEEAMPRKR